MAHAICQKCGARVSWYGGRGAKLSEQKHKNCGGQLQGLTAGRAGANKGCKMEICVLCESRRKLCQPAGRPFKCQGWLAVRHGDKIFPAGSMLCVRHRKESEYNDSWKQMTEGITYIDEKGETHGTK